MFHCRIRNWDDIIFYLVVTTGIFCPPFLLVGEEMPVDTGYSSNKVVLSSRLVSSAVYVVSFDLFCILFRCCGLASSELLLSLLLAVIAGPSIASRVASICARSIWAEVRWGSFPLWCLC